MTVTLIKALALWTRKNVLNFFSWRDTTDEGELLVTNDARSWFLKMVWLVPRKKEELPLKGCAGCSTRSRFSPFKEDLSDKRVTQGGDGQTTTTTTTTKSWTMFWWQILGWKSFANESKFNLTWTCSDGSARRKKFEVRTAHEKGVIGKKCWVR